MYDVSEANEAVHPMAEAHPQNSDIALTRFRKQFPNLSIFLAGFFLNGFLGVMSLILGSVPALANSWIPVVSLNVFIIVGLLGVGGALVLAIFGNLVSAATSRKADTVIFQPLAFSSGVFAAFLLVIAILIWFPMPEVSETPQEEGGWIFGQEEEPGWWQFWK